MLPTTHLMMTLPIVLTCRLDLPLSLGILLGSVFPDKLDFFFSGGNYRTWTQIHRTWSHSWWVILLCFFSTFLVSSTGAIGDIALPMVRGLFLGMFFHVMCDILTPAGIPLLWPFGRKYGFGIIPSRGFRATLLCSCCFFLTLWIVYIQFFQDSQVYTLLDDILERLKSTFPQIKELFGKAVAVVQEK